MLLLLLGAVVGACSSDSGDDTEGPPAGGSSAPAAYGTELDADILFSPMYSAYDGGAHEFKIPVVVNGYTGVTWEASDMSMVDMVETGPNSIMITTRKAGVVRIIARSGGLSGSAELTITEASPADWELGQQRYDNGVPLPTLDPMMAMAMGFNLGDDLSCKNCHGGSAMALSVEHTPQQTGGYSDADLIGIFTMGMKPPVANWRSGIPMFIYTMLHTWGATPDEQRGLVTYLRSIEPMSQGPIDFPRIGRGGMAGSSAAAGSGASGSGAAGSGASGSGGGAGM